MFNMTQIGKTIRQARIQQNMTQMELADRMGVSFQAVSNWERGNSMPDISKLESLCDALHLDLQQLLAGEPGTTEAVVKVLRADPEPLSVEELADVAPLLPPAEMQTQTRKTSSGKKFNLKRLSSIIPFLDEEMLEEILEEVQVDSLMELADIAPFLDEDKLDELVMASSADDWDGVIALAPFLGDKTLNTLASRCLSTADSHGLLSLAPFLSEKTLSQIALTVGPDSDTLAGLAPFLDTDTLDKLVEKQLEKGNAKDLATLYPFLGRKTMRKVLRHILDSGDMDGVEEAAAFL